MFKETKNRSEMHVNMLITVFSTKFIFQISTSCGIMTVNSLPNDRMGVAWAIFVSSCFVSVAGFFRRAEEEEGEEEEGGRRRRKRCNTRHLSYRCSVHSVARYEPVTSVTTLNSPKISIYFLVRVRVLLFWIISLSRSISGNFNVIYVSFCCMCV